MQNNQEEKTRDWGGEKALTTIWNSHYCWRVGSRVYFIINSELIKAKCSFQNVYVKAWNLFQQHCGRCVAMTYVGPYARWGQNQAFESMAQIEYKAILKDIKRKLDWVNQNLTFQTWKDISLSNSELNTKVSQNFFSHWILNSEYFWSNTW